MKKYLVVAAGEDGSEWLLAETDEEKEAERQLYRAIHRGAEESWIVTEYSSTYYSKLEGK